ncbi:MAG: ribbon-helix-helix protein, CopG family [Thermomicrobiales bacterium]
MVATQTSLSLPKELIAEIEAASAETNRPTDVLIRAAVRQYVRSNRQWRQVQEEGAKIAASLGLRPEDDIEAFVEEFMDSLEDEA